MNDTSPIANAYTLGTDEYKLIYIALNQFYENLETDDKQALMISDELNLSLGEMFYKLETLLTDNADPDRE